jgi:Acyl-[acyl carrier protein]--UDP-N-acetylglucosamine O-acyltransferase
MNVKLEILLSLHYNVPLGGHVTIEDAVVIGGNSAVQHFTKIGRLLVIGGMTGLLNTLSHLVSLLDIEDIYNGIN